LRISIAAGFAMHHTLFATGDKLDKDMSTFVAIA
jgi:hypothetical protein